MKQHQHYKNLKARKHVRHLVAYHYKESRFKGNEGFGHYEFFITENFDVGDIRNLVEESYFNQYGNKINAVILSTTKF